MSSWLDWLPPWSFGAAGFKYRSRVWQRHPARTRSLSGRTVVVTGGSRGIGRAVVAQLLERGAHVIAVSRNRGDLTAWLGADGREALVGGGRLVWEAVDLSSVAETRALIDRLRGLSLDGLVLNAGVLLSQATLSADGNDVAFATNVLTPYLLLRELGPLLSVDGRIVMVSSGGMLLATLDLEQLQGKVEPYDGVKVYAQTKRAQVCVTARVAPALRTRKVLAFSMHPGWVDTDGVSQSLPSFSRWMKPFLRNAAQGADTIVHLLEGLDLAEHVGAFYFDRQPVAITAPFVKAPTQERVDGLLAMLEQKLREAA